MPCLAILIFRRCGWRAAELVGRGQVRGRFATPKIAWKATHMRHMLVLIITEEETKPTNEYTNHAQPIRLYTNLSWFSSMRIFSPKISVQFVPHRNDICNVHLPNFGVCRVLLQNNSTPTAPPADADAIWEGLPGMDHILLGNILSISMGYLNRTTLWLFG